MDLRDKHLQKKHQNTTGYELENIQSIKREGEYNAVKGSNKERLNSEALLAIFKSSVQI